MRSHHCECSCEQCAGSSYWTTSGSLNHRVISPPFFRLSLPKSSLHNAMLKLPFQRELRAQITPATKSKVAARPSASLSTGLALFHKIADFNGASRFLLVITDLGTKSHRTARLAVPPAIGTGRLILKNNSRGYRSGSIWKLWDFQKL
jgi:hypothetical protein